MKVRIFGDDDQVVPAGVLPYLHVSRGAQPDGLNMDGAGIDIGPRIDKPRRQVLIEQQPHAVDANW